MDTLTLQERAAQISQTATALADALAQTGHPQPTFEHGIPAHLHGDAPESAARDLKQQLFAKVDELRALLTDPVATLVPEMRLPTLSVNPIVRLVIAENFPENGTTVSDLAQALNLNETLVRRLLAHAATHHIFYESKPDFFIHTAASRVLSENKGMRDWVRVGAEEVFPGAFKIGEALIQFPNSEETEHCGWSLANNTDQGCFQALATQPERAARIATTMNWQMQHAGFSPSYLAEAFPWPNEDSTDFTIVDVGGSLGHISHALATSTSHPAASQAKFIIQDMPAIIVHSKAALPGNLKDRFSFQEHDFFTPQPVHGADVYLLRSVLHDWSDKYAAKILQALIPGLKSGAKVVINERIIPAFHEEHYLVERQSRDFDMYMLGFSNARERTRRDWEAVISAADERFQLTEVRQQKGSLLAVLEVTWLG
ncbi:O-methyltransferase-domain-containing protein [Aspergillus karnatakaensis]|uniref:O-methyltransferase-domain-containing protein n=1 Tax=Aspergillus karnatakaensis TaxID=1810916 RepID=UPI003CCDAB14